MTIIKCKMCGGNLDLVEGASTAVCEYCGSVQTVPKADDDKKLQLFSRANRLRASCEFDKAAGVFESIVADFPTEAEAYWGLILCKYGIEYVEDPATSKKIPTCHRSSFQSVMDDPDFGLVMENSDATSRRVYRDEAKAIEELRKNIVSISSAEDPYDIFICYKETDENGGRTLDSVLAQDVYDALTEKGYRVFFSRISLEDKLGIEYEPYIFAALNSAKIMLAFGTDYEYFNAVWVKNEWSRYLKLMEQDKTCYLIPCYKGIDAYDIPQEFARLQGQDLGKLGAVQDLLRGIGKLLPKNTPAITATSSDSTPSAGGVAISNLLKRAEMALEDEKWSTADDFCEQVLNAEVDNGEAYLYKFMAAAHISSRRTIEEHPELLFEASESLKKDIARIYRHANASLAQWLKELEKTHTLRRQEEIRRAQEAAEEQKRQEELKRLRAAQQAEARNKLQKLQGMIFAGHHWGPSACVKADGSVLVAAKKKCKSYQATAWDNVKAIVGDGWDLIGLRADGTVVTFSKDPKYDRRTWNNIQAIAGGEIVFAGLRTDGTVATSWCDFDAAKKWSDITSISVGEDHIVGLKSNGTVVATGRNKEGQCNVDSWRDIVAVSAHRHSTIGLKQNGSVVATGLNVRNNCDVNSWRDVVAISAGSDHTLGLRADGTVYIASNKESLNKFKLSAVRDWDNIIAISAGYRCSLGLRADGTVLVAGEIKHGRENIEGANLFDNLPPEQRQALLHSLVDARNNYFQR